MPSLSCTNRAFFVLCLLAVCPLPCRADEPSPRPDLSAIRQVQITGDASELTITASPAAPYSITLTNRRRGWFANWQSSWFFDRCAAASSITAEGPVLKVHTVASSWYSIADCVVDAVINVPKDTAVDVNQDAAWLRLYGDFGRISAEGSAMDFSLDGHAPAISLSGKAMHVQASYSRVEKNEQIDIHSNALLADLEFGAATPVDYAVTGTSAFVDSRLPSAPGALPRVRIDGNFVRATIR